MVLFSHTWVLSARGVTGIHRVDEALEGGFLGVNLFFVLSGFLITALLLDEEASNGRVAVGSFYARRALRLLPALFLLLTVHAVYAQLTDLDMHTELTTIRASLLYHLNWQTSVDLLSTVPDLGHLWSLAVEEQFYLVWPAVLILFLGVRRRASVVVAVVVTFITAIVVWRALLWESETRNVFTFIGRTDVQLDSLLVGVLFAVLWVRGLTPRRGLVAAAWLGTAVIAAMWLFAKPELSFVYLGGFTVFALAGGMLILATIDSSWIGNRLLEWSPMRAIGRVSYGIYLWHLPVFYVVGRYGQSWSHEMRVLAALVGTAVCALASWFLIERPALRLKARFERRTAAPAIAAS